MAYGIFILLLSMGASAWWISLLRSKHPQIDSPLLMRMMFYHFLLAFVYYLYATFNPSDSQYYYTKVLLNYRGETWASFYGTSTKFIEFIAYPLIKFLGFSYEAVMAVFAMLGFLGFLYFYVFFSENLRFNNKLFGFNFLSIIFFLPNLHFWSSSLGKGAVIFLALGLYFYGIANLRSRYFIILLSGVLIYHIRPHIMLVILLSSVIGFVFSTKGISIAIRLTFLFGAAIAFFFIYRDVLAMVGIDEDQVITQGLDLTHRASELTKATSGVDITSYSLPLQLFTFLYRPLFFDAPGMLGIIVSFENLFYLIITVGLFTGSGIRFLWFSNFLVKTCFVAFITVSVALAQVSGNLGLAMRQKSQVMILFLFVIISFMDQNAMRRYRATELARLKRANHPTRRSQEPQSAG